MKLKVIFTMVEFAAVSLDGTTLLLLLAVAGAVASACYTGPDIGTATSVASAPAASGDAGRPPSGLPCEIVTLIEKHCASCHASPPRTGAKSVVTTREALLAEWEGRPLAVVSLERMRETLAPMPPEGLLPESEVAMFATWVEAGMPEGTCGSAAGAAPAPIELKCTSNRFWTEGDDEGDKLMTPGRACIGCHTKENRKHAGKRDDEHGEDDDDEHDGEEHELEAPAFSAAGTVYPTLHEPDDCFGLGATGTQVILTGADGRELTLAVNRAGNFMTERKIALPYRARVVRGGKTRAMKAAQTDGDCNRCHTAEGGDAPGRIVGP